LATAIQHNTQQEYRLGSILLQRGYINSEQLRVALRLQESVGLQLGEALLQLGYISPRQLKRALRRQNWLRSLAAGIALLSSPLCPIITSAGANPIESDPADGWQATLSSEESAQGGQLTFTASSIHGARLGLEFKLSETQPNMPFHRGDSSNQWQPEISLFTSRYRNPDTRIGKGRSDRYKNTLPAVFRLTLKGYCLMQVAGNDVQTWEFNRVKEKDIRKYQLMFSVTKHF